jgi:very-short-patch-repair endonuclease
MDRGLHSSIAVVAARQHGLLTLDQARDLGMTRHQVAHLVREGRWRAPHLGVFQIAGSPSTPGSRIMAATLAAGPTAMASHRTAAWLHGLTGRTFAKVELTVAAEYRSTIAGLLVHRTKQLDPVDRCTVDGLPATSIGRTLLDLGAVWPFELVEPIAQDALIRKTVAATDLVALLERVGRSGRNGTAVLRAIVHQSIPDSRLESELERRLLELIRRAGLPMPALQYEIETGIGTIRLDSAWPDTRVTAEADGRRWHANATHARRDLRRSNAIQGAGWTHLRYGWDDIVRCPDRTMAELVRCHERWAA